MVTMTTNNTENSTETEPQTHVHRAVTKTVLARHSTRVFLPDAVPDELLEQCLSLSQHAPSSTNMQPWRVTIVQGAALQRLSNALTHAVRDLKQPSQVPPIPDAYKQYRSELGHDLYGERGYNIPRGEKDAMQAAQLRNYRFFDAPVGAVIAIEKGLSPADILSVGLYLQTFILLLTERGIGTCAEVSVAGYPDVIRSELGLSENLDVLCGLAIGFEDSSHHVNQLKMARDKWRESVKFISD